MMGSLFALEQLFEKISNNELRYDVIGRFYFALHISVSG